MNILRLAAWGIIGGLLVTGFCIGLLATLSTCGVGY